MNESTWIKVEFDQSTNRVIHAKACLHYYTDQLKKKIDFDKGLIKVLGTHLTC
jgi:hypothetical protein